MSESWKETVLSEGEIIKIVGHTQMHKFPGQLIALASIQAVITGEIAYKAGIHEVEEWGIQPCFDHRKGGGLFTKRECPECWKQLKEES